tara:strand:+ start:296 stop:514 length:219 start_codon:yes stop_codon:yes gene_type:complete
MYKSTQTSTFENIKHVRIQTEDQNGKYRSVNKYYVDGKLVTNHERFIAESTMDNTPIDKVLYTVVSNFPVHN